MAIFRSKEESVKDQVPLHHLQECIGAYHAMLHMIANRMDAESWTLGKFQASFLTLVSTTPPPGKRSPALILSVTRRRIST